MFNTLYLPEIREMLASGDTAGLSDFCSTLHPGRTAEFMQGLSTDEAWAVLMRAEPALRADIFSFFDDNRQEQIVETQDRNEIATLVAELAPDDRVDLLKQVTPNVVEELLPLLPVEERRDIIRLRAHPEGTAGSVMTTEFAKLIHHSNVGEAFEAIRLQSEELETVYYLYVVDDEDHLRGVVTARQLLSVMNRPETPLAELMETEMIVAHVGDDQEDVANKVARYDIMAIPVVDDEHRILGIITHDDIFDVVREEAAEDAHRIAAVDPLDEGYLETGILTLGWKRGIWLTVLFMGAFLTAFALKRYDLIIEKHAELVLFIPLIISSGGNSGSQAATLIITAMTLGEIKVSDWWRVVKRELIMGGLLGSVLGLLGFGAAWFFLTGPTAIMGALTLLVTVLLTVYCGTMAGALLPLLFKRLGLDPALMSSPFVAGIVDILGIVIYFNVASLLIH